MKEVGTFYSATLIGPEHLEGELKLLYVHDGIDYLEYSHLLTYQTSIIFVFIHPGSSQDRWATYRTDGAYYRAYIQSFYQELVPRVEEALASINIKHKGLLGDSLAGNISVALALENPQYWSHLLLQSAAIMKEEIDRFSHIEGPLDWKVYQSVGRNEDDYRSIMTGEPLHIFTRNQQLNRELLQRNATVDLNILDTDHGWVYWDQDLPQLMKFFK